MRTVTEYSIAEGSNPLKLASAVNAAIRDGFEPFGIITVLEDTSAGTNHRFLQPVVRYETTSPS